jgi:hypothetical protein
LSLRKDFGFRLLNNVGSVKTLDIFGDTHFALWDSHEPLRARGGILWFEYEMVPTDLMY